METPRQRSRSFETGSAVFVAFQQPTVATPEPTAGKPAATPGENPVQTPNWKPVADEQIEDFWQDYLADNALGDRRFRQLIDELTQAERFDHVIAVIEAAIIAGEGRPWMYEILALAMDIDGRPKADIERVLLSSVDFVSADVSSIVYLAAYLTRFGRDRQALDLYRQATELEPAQAEPYVMGLKLAQKLDDVDAVEWAAAGILMYDWGKGFAARHDQALAVVADVAQKLRDDDPERLQTLQATIARARVRDLELHVRWAGEGNIDLLVDEPPGTQCSLDQPRTSAGGVLAQDGDGRRPDECRATYINPLSFSGTYRFRIRYMWGNIVGKRCQVTLVRHAGSDSETRQEWVIPIDTEDRVLRIHVPHGRRAELSAVVAPLPKVDLVPRISDPVTLGKAFAQAGNAILAQQQQQQGGGQQGFVTGAGGGGGGAIGYQPGITTLSEGVQLSASAVVSADRRYVRLSLVPSFSTITDVFTFSFANTGGQ